MENSKTKSIEKRILVVILCFSLVISYGYILYDKVFSREATGEEEQKSSGKKKEEALDIHSGFIQSLYSNVSDTGGNSCFLNIMNIGEKEKETVLASDIENETKWKMGYDLVVENQKLSLDCNKYPATNYFEENQLTTSVNCGDAFYNPETKRFDLGDNVAYTEMVLEDDIQRKVNQIFGPNTYQHVDKIQAGNNVYKYVEEEKGYIKLSVPNDETCNVSIGHTLIDAIKKEDKIILTEDVITLENKHYSFIYTYKLGKDDSYYFYSLEKERKEVEK